MQARSPTPHASVFLLKRSLPRMASNRNPLLHLQTSCIRDQWVGYCIGYFLMQTLWCVVLRQTRCNLIIRCHSSEPVSVGWLRIFAASYFFGCLVCGRRSTSANRSRLQRVPVIVPP